MNEGRLGMGRAHCTIFDILVCDECGYSNWDREYDRDCPRCGGLGCANQAQICAFDDRAGSWFAHAVGTCHRAPTPCRYCGRYSKR